MSTLHEELLTMAKWLKRENASPDQQLDGEQLRRILARHPAPVRHPDREPDDAHPETEPPSSDPATWNDMRIGTYLQTMPEVPLEIGREVLLRLGAIRVMGIDPLKEPTL